MAPPFGLIKKLQKQTGKGFGICKKALTTYNNDLDAAAASLDPAAAAQSDGLRESTLQTAQQHAGASTSVNPAAVTKSMRLRDSTTRNIRESTHAVAHDAIARDPATVSNEQIHQVNLHPALEKDLVRLGEPHVEPEPAPAESVTLPRHQIFSSRRSWEVDDDDFAHGEKIHDVQAPGGFVIADIKIFSSVINSDAKNVDRAIRYTPECIHERTEKGQTPLHVAAEDGSDKARWMINSLLKAGADVQATDSKGRTPLHAATRHNRTDNMRLLVDAGARIETEDIRGNRALHMAASKGHMDALKQLVEFGSDLSTTNAEGKTPFVIAQEHWKASPRAFKKRKYEVYKYLKKLGR